MLGFRSEMGAELRSPGPGRKRGRPEIDTATTDAIAELTATGKWVSDGTVYADRPDAHRARVRYRAGLERRNSGRTYESRVVEEADRTGWRVFIRRGS